MLNSTTHLRRNDYAVVVAKDVIARVDDQLAVDPLDEDRFLIIHCHGSAERLGRIAEAAEGRELHFEQLDAVARAAIDDRTDAAGGAGGGRADLAELAAVAVVLSIAHLNAAGRHVAEHAQADVVRRLVAAWGTHHPHGERRPCHLHGGIERINPSAHRPARKSEMFASVVHQAGVQFLKPGSHCRHVVGKFQGCGLLVD